MVGWSRKSLIKYLMLGHAELPKKGLKIAHINICSIRNKIPEITEILKRDQLHILAISETHLDSTFEDSVLNIQGYKTEMHLEEESLFLFKIICQ